MKVKNESEVAQSCPTFSDPMGCSPPGSSVHGTLQARALEWVASASSGTQHRSTIGAPKYMEQILKDLSGETDYDIIQGDFYSPLTSKDRSYRQKLSKKTLALKQTLDHMC